MGELVVRSPYDGRELDTVITSGIDQVNDALDTAYALFRNRDSWLSVPERLAILNKAAEIMQSQVEELTLLAASEGGKPYADSRVEVLRAIDGVRLCADRFCRGCRRTVIWRSSVDRNVLTDDFADCCPDVDPDAGLPRVWQTARRRCAGA